MNQEKPSNLKRCTSRAALTWVLLIHRGMAEGQFRVEELNLFLEWHLHTTARSLESASSEATRIARMIGRKTRVLSADGAVLLEVGVPTET